MGIADADSAEHNTASAHHIIVPVSCATPWSGGEPKLAGSNNVTIVPGTRLASAYGGPAIAEQFFCNYEVDAGFRPWMEAAGLRISAYGPAGEVRAVELPGHDFFVATLFQPQLTSAGSGEPHPLIDAFLLAAREAQIRGARSEVQKAGVSRP